MLSNKKHTKFLVREINSEKWEASILVKEKDEENFINEVSGKLIAKNKVTVIQTID